ncbi:MAG: hypothetical protein MI748_05370 [Opitutales bacterium]|nr:hypothetical protein [Opitutales bacterium]
MTRAIAGVEASRIAVLNSVFASFNVLDGQGGALHAELTGSVVINNTLFLSNMAGLGGAVSLRETPSEIVNSEFASNGVSRLPGASGERKRFAGALYLASRTESMQVILRGCTFTGNTADGDGGAVAAFLAGLSYLHVEDCMFADNVNRAYGREAACMEAVTDMLIWVQSKAAAHCTWQLTAL